MPTKRRCVQREAESRRRAQPSRAPRGGTAARGAPWITHVLVSLAVAFAGACAPAAAAGGDATQAHRAEAADDPLTAFGARATVGAAPGYLADAVCGRCHPVQAASFAKVGMGRSLTHPTRARALEDVGRTFHHAASDQYFRMHREADGGLVFERWQQDAAGARINAVRERVAWVLGSGHRARVYLVRNPAGELYQLPIAWYAQSGRFAMAPGYDRVDHDNLGRRIRRECLACHTAYPEVPAGADAYGQPALFPETLPEGIGCQRCHGPGAEHVRLLLVGAGSAAAREAIVDPRRLPPARRDDVCFQCHLQPSVAFAGTVRDGLGDFGYRPGEPLAAHRVVLDVVESGRAPEDRFEINHHGHRLRQSPCHREGGLGCIDCHDPHRPLADDPRLAGADAVCARCHTAHAVARDAPQPAADCTGCHLPKRRTEDVVHVAMTDHRIARRPPPDPLAPRREREPSIADVRPLDLPAAPRGAEAAAHRARTVLSALPTADAYTALARLLDDGTVDTREAWWDRISAALRLGRHAEAAARLPALIARWPEEPQWRAWHAVAAIGTGRWDVAATALDAAIRMAPDQAEFHLNRALVHEQAGERDAARAAAQRALALRPNLVPAWLTAARLDAADGDHARAAERFRRALALDPRQTRAYAGLVRSLRAAGERREAARWLAHGRRHASDPQRLEALLAAP